MEAARVGSGIDGMPLNPELVQRCAADSLSHSSHVDVDDAVRDAAGAGGLVGFHSDTIPSRQQPHHTADDVPAVPSQVRCQRTAPGRTRLCGGGGVQCGHTRLVHDGVLGVGWRSSHVAVVALILS